MFWILETKFIVLQRAKRGQFQVVDQINNYLSYLQPGVDEAKAHLDHIIDLCGEAPKGKIGNKMKLFYYQCKFVMKYFLMQGTGLQNLRECILWTQTKHDFELKKKRPFWKQMSKNFIERYCYLIVFTTYVKAFHSRGE